jgi:hypothetical protein
MKEIRTKRYAQSFGNHGLPPGVTEGDINNQFGGYPEQEDINNVEQFEIERNWDTFQQEYGEPGQYMPKGIMPLTVTAKYFISFDVDGKPSDIKIKVQKITTLLGNDVTKFGIDDAEQEVIKGQIIEMMSDIKPDDQVENEY